MKAGFKKSPSGPHSHDEYGLAKLSGMMFLAVFARV
jgi:hypothetical protein